MDKFVDANKASVILLPAMTFSHITFCIFQMLPFDFPCLPSQNASLWEKKKDSLPEPKVVLNILLLTGIGLG